MEDLKRLIHLVVGVIISSYVPNVAVINMQTAMCQPTAGPHILSWASKWPASAWWARLEQGSSYKQLAGDTQLHTQILHRQANSLIGPPVLFGPGLSRPAIVNKLQVRALVCSWKGTCVGFTCAHPTLLSFTRDFQHAILASL
jgi:hypothetical protein